MQKAFMKKLFLLPLLAALFLVGCSASKPIDAAATSETKALYQNLGKLSKKHTLFGHQHATEYGHGWSGDQNRSDVASVTGSHPAVVGVDFSGFSGRSPQAIAQAKEAVRQNVVDTYNRGGVTTAAWHFSNPVSPGGFYWVDSLSLPAVRYIIPGGEAHAQYKEILDGIGAWAHSVRGADGKLAPVIFRPFHEFDGGWFWWGKPYASREEFISLWQFTVSYLRDSLDVHNFIYAFTPDNKFRTEAEFLERYPGDAWVDMVGMDNYGDMGRDRYAVDTAAMKLKIVSDYAKKAGKLAAFTETGLESIPDTAWWTNTLLRTMKRDDMRLSYVLVWRNDIRSPTHYYAPYPGQVSIPDFMRFYHDDYTLFEKDLNHIYEKKKFLGLF
ncbi:glycoside hydrolase family 26 protein [Pontibacter sp. E15-1]|uniref:glycoside hydrolase family 26 protein n=1 Tax=Pontibacter sp. E15-1 TaxID=2919918 RepID=UPI001F50013E|nr:glycosyl hydrolase [Pontibacter sp. E15-1]MCJ8163415.1 glycoside hydrolase family 26 protein [Pontibacter sp. E15-1]